MGNKDAVRTGVNLTVEDRLIIRKLKKQLQAEHGKQTVTSIIRIALRKAVRE
jgi:purine-nucleoside phosphorylase